MILNIIQQLKKNVIRGILLIIPTFLTYLVLKFLYHSIDKKILTIIDKYLPIRFPGLGVILLILMLFIIGYLANILIINRFIRYAEQIIEKIPLIKTTYTIGKQITSTFQLSEKQAFKRSVFIRYLSDNNYVLGFVTGQITQNKTNEKYLKIFVPTPPNPTTGFIVIVKENDALDTGWSIEESIKAVISVGIISPDKFG